MTIYSAASQGSGGVSHLPGPDGIPKVGAADTVRPAIWTPDRLARGYDFDTLMAPNPTDEATVLADGGMAYGDGNQYFAKASTPRASLLAGPGPRKAAQVQGANGVLQYPIDGGLSHTEFTVEVDVYLTGTTDFAALASDPTIFKITSGGTTSLLVKRSTGGLHATLAQDERAWGGTLSQLDASFTLATGDIPATTWVTVSVVFTGTTLKIILGNNTKSGTATGTNPLTRPWSGDPVFKAGAGVVVSTDRAAGATDLGLICTVPACYRYARTYNQSAQGKKPMVTVDAGSASGAWPYRCAGVIAAHTGNAQTEAAQTSTAVRDQQLATAGQLGMNADRRGDYHLRAVPTLNTTAPGSITGMDYTDLDALWDRLAANFPGGVDVHMHIGFTPVAFGGTSGASYHNVPTIAGLTQAQTFALLADYWSRVILHLQGKYGATQPIVSLSFWNELYGYWTSNGGTVTQARALWNACATKINADQAANGSSLRLGGPEEPYDSNVNSTTGAGNSGDYQRGILTEAQTGGFPMPNLSYHSYDGNLAKLLENVKALKDTAAGNGFGSPKVIVSELGYQIGSAEVGATGLASQQVARRMGSSLHGAAYTFAAIYELIQAGVSMVTTYKLGQFDTYNAASGGEEIFGLFSKDNPTRMWPLGAVYELLWKHKGNRVTASTNWPGLRALASKATDGTITVTFGSFRPFKADERRAVQFEWAGLPTSFTWKQWRMDARDVTDGRPYLLSQGDQSNLPLGTDLTAVGVGCVQITPA